MTARSARSQLTDLSATFIVVDGGFVVGKVAGEHRDEELDLHIGVSPTQAPLEKLVRNSSKLIG